MDPNGILGLSVGWGDKYDYTDNGENIDITTLPDGTYWLRSTTDPYHLLQETNPGNNITDTQLKISGDTVTVLQQTHPDSTPPAVQLTSPADGSSVSGTVTLSATATPVAGSSIQGVQFLVDGQAVPGTVTSNPPQYSISWNAAPAGAHIITAQATATGSGFVGTARPALVTVPTQIGSLVVDQTFTTDGTGTTTSTPAFSTSTAGELLLAFVGADGPSTSQAQTVTVSGAGLSWTLVSRANTQFGTAEIWSATASAPLNNVTVTSTEGKTGYNQSLTVLLLHSSAGTASVGAHVAAGAVQSAPAVTVTTTGNGSWVLGIGNDWDQAVVHTLGSNQQMVHQWVDTAVGDTFWVQSTTGVIPSSGTSVSLNDTAPTTDRWNFSAVEVLAAGAPPPPPDTTPPTVAITSPISNATVSGSVRVTANATDNVALSSTNPVVFYLDTATSPLGPVTANGSQFSTVWDSTRTANGNHTVKAVATDTSNNQSTATVPVSVANPPPAMGCFVVDAKVAQHGRGPVTTPAFNTALAGERLLAFVGSDGPSTGSQTASVSGAGLTWTLVKRANAQAGTAEIWTASAPAPLKGATVTARQGKTGYDMSLYVIAVQGTGGIGASVAAGARSGAPTLKLTTTKAGSLLYAVGNDYDNASARAVGTNQMLDDQWLDTGTGDTYWVQNQTYPPLIPAGSTVTLNDTSPTTDRWNFAGVEILGE